MTIRAIAKILARYIGVTSFNPAANANALNLPGLGDNDLTEIATCINGALEEIYQNGPASLVTKTVGEVLRVPTSITFTATQYAKTMGGVSGYETWMNGCTVRIGGDNSDNRLVATAAAASVTVTGTLTPDVTGTYYLQGAITDNNNPFYLKAGAPNVEIIRDDYGDWFINGRSNAAPGWTKSFVVGPSDPPSGSYSPTGGSATGTATVTANSTAVSLRDPYMGSTGSVTATVYADNLALDSSYASVIEPVRIPNRAPMVMAGSAEVFDGCDLSAIQRTPPLMSWVTTNKTIGEPTVCLAESDYNATDTHTLTHLRFAPMPGAAYTVGFKVRLRAPVVTSADIDGGTPYTSDPNTVLPLEMMASILLPFALQRWTAHPAFSARDEQLQEIGRQYQVAMQELKRERRMIARTPAIYLEG